MRRLQDIDPPAAMGRPARGGPRGPSRIDEKRDSAQPDAPASPPLAGIEPASGHLSGQNGNSDLEKYLVHIAHLDLALPVKIELISALRDIMQSFVDRAFGEDPTQLCLDDRDRNKTDTDLPANVVGSTDNTPDNTDKDFRSAARPLDDNTTKS